MLGKFLGLSLVFCVAGCAPAVYIVGADEKNQTNESGFETVTLMCMRDANHQICESSALRRNQGHWIEYKNGIEFARFREVKIERMNDNPVHYGVDTRPVYIKVEKQRDGNYYYAYYANATTTLEKTQWTMMQGKFVPVVRGARQQ